MGPEVEPTADVRFIEHYLSAFISIQKYSIYQPPNMTVMIVDSLAAVVLMLDTLNDLPSQPPSLYCDLEGVQLSRHGSISIIQIFVSPHHNIYLIDIYILGDAAFNARSSNGTSLKSILESAAIPKVFFDVRNDSDALYAHSNISVRGIQDLQLMEVAVRNSNKKHVSGLAHCIKQYAKLSKLDMKVWKETKDAGKAIFDPENGGTYEVFNIRPMIPGIVEYCAQDVIYMPILWSVFVAKMTPKWAEKVRVATLERVRESQSDLYEPHGEHKARSPWATKQVHVPNWTCTVCSKQMQTSSREAHLAGQSHAAKARASGSTGTHPNALTSNLIQQAKAAKRADVSNSIVQVTSAAVNQTHPTPGPSLNPLPEWTCSVCSRTMQTDQRDAHLAGQPHAARVKASHKTASNTSAVNPSVKPNRKPEASADNVVPSVSSVTTSTTTSTTTGTSLLTSETPTTPSKKNANHIPPRPKSKGAKGRGSKATTTSSISHLSTTNASPWEEGDEDCGFVGFSQGGGGSGSGSGSSSGRGYYDSHPYYYSSGADRDYGACDKDCGWCGRCMERVYIE